MARDGGFGFCIFICLSMVLEARDIFSLVYLSVLCNKLNSN